MHRHATVREVINAHRAWYRGVTSKCVCGAEFGGSSASYMQHVAAVVEQWLQSEATQDRIIEALKTHNTAEASASVAESDYRTAALGVIRAVIFG